MELGGFARYYSLREEFLVLNAGVIFCWLLFFVGITFHTKKINRTLTISYCNCQTPPHPNSNMISPVVTIAEGMKENKRTKTKIRVESVVKAKVGEMEENTREGRSRSIRKEVVGCVQAFVGKKKILFKFKDGKKKEMSSSLLQFLC